MTPAFLLFSAGMGAFMGAACLFVMLTGQGRAMSRLRAAGANGRTIRTDIHPRNALERSALLAGWSREEMARWRERRFYFAAGGFLVVSGGLGLRVGWESLSEPGAWLLAAGCAGVGWWWPRRRLEEHARSRQERIQSALPAFLDRFVLGVTAGLNVRQSFRLAARRAVGDLGSLTRRAVQRLDVGATLEEALAPEFPALSPGPTRLVLSALVKAESLGTPLIRVAEEQAEFVRRIGHFEAQRSVESLPLKLTLCCVGFLFPPVFIVILVPNLLALIRSGW